MNTRITGTGYSLPAFRADNDYLATLVAVSYTHLDVYKRQGLTTRADVPDDKVLCYLLERQLQEITTNISVKFEIEVWYNSCLLYTS